MRRAEMGVGAYSDTPGDRGRTAGVRRRSPSIGHRRDTVGRIAIRPYAVMALGTFNQTRGRFLTTFLNVKGGFRRSYVEQNGSRSTGLDARK